MARRRRRTRGERRQDAIPTNEPLANADQVDLRSLLARMRAEIASQVDRRFERELDRREREGRAQTRRRVARERERDPLGGQPGADPGRRRSITQSAFSAIRGGQAFARGIRGESLIAGVGVARRALSQGGIKSAVEAILFTGNLIDRLAAQIATNEDFIAESVLKFAQGVVENVTFQRFFEAIARNETARLSQEILSDAFINNIAARLAEDESFRREAARVADREFEQTERFRRVQSRSERDKAR